MNKKLRSLFGLLRIIRLTTAERAELRQRIFAKIYGENAVRVKETARLTGDMIKVESLLKGLRKHPTLHLTTDEKAAMLRTVRSHTSGKAHFKVSRFEGFFRFRLAPIAAIILLGAGGTAAAAESSLPGEFLYPVKIHVSENVRTKMLFYGTARAEWSIRRAERRLEEAELLAARAGIDFDVSANINANFQAHIEEADREIAKLRSSGNAQASAEFDTRLESALEAHGSVLKNLVDKNENNDVRRLLRSVVEKTGKRTKFMEESGEEKSDDEKKTADETFQHVTKASIKAAKNELIHGRTFIRNNQKNISKDSLEKARKRLDDAETILKSAEEELNTGSHTRAFEKTRSTLKEAKEATLMLKTDIEFEQHQRTNVRTENNDRDENSDDLEMKNDTRINTEQKIELPKQNTPDLRGL